MLSFSREGSWITNQQSNCTYKSLFAGCVSSINYLNSYSKHHLHRQTSRTRQPFCEHEKNVQRTPTYSDSVSLRKNEPGSSDLSLTSEFLTKFTHHILPILRRQTPKVFVHLTSAVTFLRSIAEPTTLLLRILFLSLITWCYTDARYAQSCLIPIQPLVYSKSSHSL